MSQENQTRKKNYFKMIGYSQRLQVTKCSNTLNLYILKGITQ